MRNVGIVRVEVIDCSHGDYPRFQCELVEEDYAKCGLRPFTGDGHRGGYDHIYSEGESVSEAVADMVRTLQGCDLSGQLRVIWHIPSPQRKRA